MHTPGLQSWEDLVRTLAAMCYMGCCTFQTLQKTICKQSAAKYLSERLLWMQTLIYAAQQMDNDRQLQDYHVPPVSATSI